MTNVITYELEVLDDLENKITLIYCGNENIIIEYFNNEADINAKIWVPRLLLAKFLEIIEGT